MDHFKFIIGALIYLCMLQYSKAITTVSQRNNKNGKLETYCVTNNESETLSWITPYDRSFYNLKDDTSHITKFIPNDWLFEASYESYLGQVLDPRWQNFETAVSKNDQEYNKYLKDNLEEYFELPFSIKYDEDAEMLFYCDSFLKQTISFQNNILTSHICPDKSLEYHCHKYRNIKENLERFSQYNKHSWNHYTIRYRKDIYTLLLNGISIAEVSIPNYGHLRRIKMKSMKGAIWRLHIYKYYRTDSTVKEIMFLNDIQASNNKLCMSAYFYFDGDLSIQIRQDSSIIKKVTYTNDKKRWTFIKIEENLEENVIKRYKFWLIYDKSISNVAFSHVKLNSHCDMDVNKIYTEFHTYLINEVTCESLNNPNSSITIGDSIKRIDSNCSIDKFGNDCIKCKSVFNTDICEETLTCVETNKCYCQPGYYGKHCKTKCDNLKANVFGSNCNKKCGNCKDKAQCHHITGNCPNGCEIYFVEPFCNETDLPYLKEAPVAETPCYTTCNIIFNPDMYEGRNSPDSYKVEVFEAGNWKVIYDKNINDKYILLDKLKILTKYHLRIVLCHRDECMEGEFVPVFYLNTDCKDLQRCDSSENINNRNIIQFKRK